MYSDFKKAPKHLHIAQAHPTVEQTHRADLHAAIDKARANVLIHARDLIDAIARHEESPDEWLAYRDAEADLKAANLALDEHLISLAARREVARIRGHLQLAEAVIEHPMTKEIRP